MYPNANARHTAPAPANVCTGPARPMNVEENVRETASVLAELNRRLDAIDALVSGPRPTEGGESDGCKPAAYLSCTANENRVQALRALDQVERIRRALLAGE
jgi:hypothetical protein